MREPFSGTAERIFVKLLPNGTGENGVCNVVPPLGESRAAAWRMANVDGLRNLRYDSFAITRGRHVIYAMTLAESPEGATHGGCVIQHHEQANGCNLVVLVGETVFKRPKAPSF